MGRIGEDWWVKNEREMKNPALLWAKTVGSTGTG